METSVNIALAALRAHRDKLTSPPVTAAIVSFQIEALDGMSLPREVTGSKTFVDREKDGIRNGPDRLHRIHVYMNRRAGTDAARWLEDAGAALAADAAVQK